MIVIRVEYNLPPSMLETVIRGIQTQAKSGVVVIGPGFEVYTDGTAPGIKVVTADEHKTDSSRVAALERQLRHAMEYISSLKDCEACKHDGTENADCCVDCLCCENTACACKDCFDGSKWEWRYGSE